MAPRAMQAYGQSAHDLDVPFGHCPPDETTTALLATCLGLEAGTVAGWTLARRLQALLAVHRADTPDTALPAVARCKACGERFELEIDLQRCESDIDESALPWAAPDGRVLALRLPSAHDLRLWRARGRHDTAALAASLLVPPDGDAAGAVDTLPTDWLPLLSAALAERDPLGALQADAACPECGHVNATDIDLEALLLAGFAHRQRALLADVATLARAFHWSEAQVLALPAWRRAHYIAQLGAGDLR